MTNGNPQPGGSRPDTRLLEPGGTDDWNRVVDAATPEPEIEADDGLDLEIETDEVNERNYSSIFGSIFRVSKEIFSTGVDYGKDLRDALERRRLKKADKDHISNEIFNVEFLAGAVNEDAKDVENGVAQFVLGLDKKLEALSEKNHRELRRRIAAGHRWTADYSKKNIEPLEEAHKNKTATYARLYEKAMEALAVLDPDANDAEGAPAVSREQYAKFEQQISSIRAKLEEARAEFEESIRDVKEELREKKDKEVELETEIALLKGDLKMQKEALKKLPKDKRDFALAEIKAIEADLNTKGRSLKATKNQLDKVKDRLEKAKKEMRKDKKLKEVDRVLSDEDENTDKHRRRQQLIEQTRANLESRWTDHEETVERQERAKREAKAAEEAEVRGRVDSYRESFDRRKRVIEKTHEQLLERLTRYGSPPELAGKISSEIKTEVLDVLDTMNPKNDVEAMAGDWDEAKFREMEEKWGATTAVAFEATVRVYRDNNGITKQDFVDLIEEFRHEMIDLVPGEVLAEMNRINLPEIKPAENNSQARNRDEAIAALHEMYYRGIVNTTKEGEFREKVMRQYEAALYSGANPVDTRAYYIAAGLGHIISMYPTQTRTGEARLAAEYIGGEIVNKIYPEDLDDVMKALRDFFHDKDGEAKENAVESLQIQLVDRDTALKSAKQEILWAIERTDALIEDEKEKQMAQWKKNVEAAKKKNDPEPDKPEPPFTPDYLDIHDNIVDELSIWSRDNIDLDNDGLVDNLIFTDLTRYAAHAVKETPIASAGDGRSVAQTLEEIEQLPFLKGDPLVPGTTKLLRSEEDLEALVQDPDALDAIEDALHFVANPDPDTLEGKLRLELTKRKAQRALSIYKEISDAVKVCGNAAVDAGVIFDDPERYQRKENFFRLVREAQGTFISSIMAGGAHAREEKIVAGVTDLAREYGLYLREADIFTHRDDVNARVTEFLNVFRPNHPDVPSEVHLPPDTQLGQLEIPETTRRETGRYIPEAGEVPDEAALERICRDYLLYMDTVPQSDAWVQGVIRKPDGTFQENYSNYATEIHSALQENPDLVESLRVAVKVDFEEAMRVLGLNPNVYSESDSWYYFDLAKQRRFSKNPDESDTRRYTLADPLDMEYSEDSREVIQQMADRHLAWEVYNHARAGTDIDLNPYHPSFAEIQQLLNQPPNTHGSLPSNDLAKLGALIKVNLALDQIEFSEPVKTRPESGGAAAAQDSGSDSSTESLTPIELRLEAERLGLSGEELDDFDELMSMYASNNNNTHTGPILRIVDENSKVLAAAIHLGENRTNIAQVTRFAFLKAMSNPGNTLSVWFENPTVRLTIDTVDNEQIARTRRAIEFISKFLKVAEGRRDDDFDFSVITPDNLVLHAQAIKQVTQSYDEAKLRAVAQEFPRFCGASMLERIELATDTREARDFKETLLAAEAYSALGVDEKDFLALEAQQLGSELYRMLGDRHQEGNIIRFDQDNRENPETVARRMLLRQLVLEDASYEATESKAKEVDGKPVFRSAKKIHKNKELKKASVDLGGTMLSTPTKIAAKIELLDVDQLEAIYNSIYFDAPVVWRKGDKAEKNDAKLKRKLVMYALKKELESPLPEPTPPDRDPTPPPAASPAAVAAERADTTPIPPAQPAGRAVKPPKAAGVGKVAAVAAGLAVASVGGAIGVKEFRKHQAKKEAKAVAASDTPPKGKDPNYDADKNVFVVDSSTAAEAKEKTKSRTPKFDEYERRLKATEFEETETSTQAEADTEPEAELEPLGKQFNEMDKDEINREIIRLAKELEGKNGGERVKAITELMLGINYGAWPKDEGRGEGAGSDITFDKMNCFTMLEAALAIASSSDYEDAVGYINNIRYRDGQPDFNKRYHIVEQWLRAMTEKGYLKDVTRRAAKDRLGVQRIPGAKISFSAESWPAQVEKWGKDIPWDQSRYGEFETPYIPLDKAIEFADNMPEGHIINVIRAPEENGITNVSHLGVIVKKDGKLFVRHATDIKSKDVLDEPIKDFLERQKRFKRRKVVGVNLVEIQ